MADHELKAWSRRTNVIATAMFAAMKGPMSVTAKAELGLARLEATLDTIQAMKIATLLFRVGDALPAVSPPNRAPPKGDALSLC